MRIIAGKYKGRKLCSPNGDSIRPTADKVKGAMFSMIDGHLAGSVVIDLFSGTGNLGLEALSRGAKKCYFVDVSREAVALTKSNISLCGAGGQSAVIAASYEKALAGIPEKADVVFLDPPYKNGLMDACLKFIDEQGALSKGGIIVCEHEGGEDLPDGFSGFGMIKGKKYGRVLISIYG
ncbi:MAG: 16S rRNA (guanine(966)-N(2))-methyltransferase RsmD [Clostridiales bacterium]|nr:16S rRNA (guanine(966)-N(2))-methyltransferase RsmD [Clostridiales bacterium]